MTARALLLILTCVALLAGGQLLFKAAAAQWRVDDGAWLAVRSLLSPAFIAALAIYGIATLLWVYVLRTVPLGMAYPLYALVFIVVPVLAHYVAGEPLSANALVGGAVIVVGVAIALR